LNKNWETSVAEESDSLDLEITHELLDVSTSDTKLGKERASLFVYTLLAIIVPFTSSMSSNLWRGLGVLFGIDIKKKRFYTFMASSTLPWKKLWRSTWGLIDSPCFKRNKIHFRKKH
jgi:hypothetical protein